MKTTSYIRHYAKDDIQEAIQRASKQSHKRITCSSLKFDGEMGSIDAGGDGVVKISAALDIDHSPASIEFNYEVNGETIYSAQSISEMVNSIIQSSTAILAADDEELAEEELLDEDDSFTNTLDDIADTVEDIQDTVDDVEEDDVDIEAENNIDGHYIAECEKCHGIFISAVIESDQDVTKISGKCPLCEKESDQYLRWVVKSVE